MGVADDLDRIARLHETGALSDEEFIQAKQQALAPSPASASSRAAGSALPTPARRLAAYLLDVGVCVLFAIGAFLLRELFFIISSFLPRPHNLGAAVSGLPMLWPFLYWTISEATTGQTLGKQMLKLRVVRSDGKPLGYGRAIARGFGRLPAAAVFGLGYLWMLWDPARRGWHDMLVDSQVVDHADASGGTPWARIVRASAVLTVLLYVLERMWGIPWVWP